MGPSTKEILTTTTSMAREFISGRIRGSTKESGSGIKCTGRESPLGLMEEAITESIQSK
jgi:hypothetical protein